MRYTVLWLPRAEQELAALWLDANQREAITRAAHELDQRPANDAQDEGESREADLRIAFAAPLGIEFQVEEEDRVVRVIQVWLFGQQRPRSS
jgi:mRNA-degrading endonuclease RelE of RelBE toxin-antitoxin system